MLGKKNFTRTTRSGRLQPEPAFSGTVSFDAVSTWSDDYENAVEVTVSSNLRAGKKLHVSFGGINSDYWTGNTGTVDSNGDVTVTAPIKLATWADIDATPITVLVKLENIDGVEVARATGNISSVYSPVTLTAGTGNDSFTIGSGENRVEGINTGATSNNPISVSNTSNVAIDYLLIAGGGPGGGTTYGGGGGAGGYLEEYTYELVNHFSGTYTIYSGAGGTGTSNGGDTVIPNITSATGGGRGGYFGTPTGAVGGSGGGGAYGGSGGAGIAFQGNYGNRANTNSSSSGGGACGAEDGTRTACGTSFPTAGIRTGGTGKYSEITGSNVAYAGGGWTIANTYGDETFGAGYTGSVDAVDGTGSGGAGSFSGSGGGDGARGIAVIRKTGDYYTSIILD